MKCRGDECPRAYVYYGRCLECNDPLRPRMIATPCQTCAGITRDLLEGVQPFDLHVKGIAGTFHWHDTAGMDIMRKAMLEGMDHAR